MGNLAATSMARTAADAAGLKRFLAKPPRHEEVADVVDSANAVAFGKAFLLQYTPPPSITLRKWPFTSTEQESEPNDLYCRASHDGNAALLAEHEVSPNSLFTFHGANADPINYTRQTTPWTLVRLGDTVMLYGNVNEGRYLAHDTLAFNTSPHHARMEEGRSSERCEFIVRHPQRRRSSNAASPLHFGQTIVLECKSRPGWYLGRQRFALTSSQRGAAKFILHSPTLPQLLELQGNRRDSWTTGVAQFSANDFVREEERIAERKERALWDALALALPLELVRKILEYKPYYLETMRLCCKSWKLAMERDSIRRVRVNGEMYSFDTREERGVLLRFLGRCKHLHRLTLRNMDTLTDEDVIAIISSEAGRNIRHLILGGCRALTDRTTREIAKQMPQLQSLNLAYTAITDQSLECMTELKMLEDINLYHCQSVSADGINQFVQSAALLRINLRGTITNKENVRRFSQRNPKVLVLTGPASAESIYG